MTFTRKIRCLLAGRWLMAVASLACALGLQGADLQLSLLRTKTGYFTNVTVWGVSKTDIFIRHSRGLGNIKLIHVDSETLRQLGLVATTAKDGTPSTMELRPAAAPASGPVEIVPVNLKTLSRADVSAMLSCIRPTPNMVTLCLALTLGLHVFLCRCLKLICEKAGHPPGAIIWFPVLQMFPLLRAAGMSGWWFLGLLIPGINLIASVVWCFKIVDARGKSRWITAFLLLPFINVLAIVYLAFSDGEEPPEKTLSLSTAKPSLALGEA